MCVSISQILRPPFGGAPYEHYGTEVAVVGGK